MKEFLICVLIIISCNSYSQDADTQKKIDKIEKLVNDINSRPTLFEIKDSSYSIDSSFHELDDFTRIIFYSDQKCGALLKMEYSVLLLKDSIQTFHIEYFKDNKLITVESAIKTNKYKPAGINLYFDNGRVLNSVTDKEEELASDSIDNSKTLLQKYLLMCNK